MMYSLAFFLFGMSMSLLGFLLFNIELTRDRITMEIARTMYSGPLFFGGFSLAVTAAIEFVKELPFLAG
ncbi:hypothetical protein J1C56_09155 [Aminobacter anthyllidis]|uniref:Uncharacterized protein n=1 Tax=Aminobacter anthyllidis TaxID=1035067 RepID=A0A9X1A9K9_9HYPH|nr:hypothetical protein [Aminobacter anthyllidis]MBT1155759.1 hypothetical protein [Aminobacter anthyllidis]